MPQSEEMGELEKAALDSARAYEFLHGRIKAGHSIYTLMLYDGQEEFECEYVCLVPLDEKHDEPGYVITSAASNIRANIMGRDDISKATEKKIMAYLSNASDSDRLCRITSEIFQSWIRPEIAIDLAQKGFYLDLGELTVEEPAERQDH